MSGGWGGFEGGWLGQSLLGRSWNSEGRRARPGLGLQEHWGCGPCVQLAWLGRFQCAASRTLPLLWWLLHARLAGFEQVSPTSRGQCQSLWERLSECPWTASSGPHGSVLQPAVLQKTNTQAVTTRALIRSTNTEPEQRGGVFQVIDQTRGRECFLRFPNTEK